MCQVSQYSSSEQLGKTPEPKFSEELDNPVGNIDWAHAGFFHPIQDVL